MMSMLASLVFVIGVTALDSFRQAQAAICNVSAPTDPTLCYETFSYPIASVVTTATPGTWEFIASDLQNLFGQSNTVDPMMWLLDNSGNILGIADDSIGSLAPKLTLTFYATVDVTIILGGFTDDRQGTVDLTVRKIGTSGTVWQDLWFGGWRRDGHRVELGDRMFVGFPHGGVSGGTPGNLLLVLSTSATTCTSGGCGSYIVSPWTAGTLSQVRVPFTSSNGSVVVGSWFQNTLQGTRWFHSRLGASWGTGSLYNDSDCDGLTVEVEELASTDENLNVQSCDNDSPSAGSRCDKFRQRIEIPTQWRANDTDHDGLRDDWELYGVKRTCTKFPAPPHFNPGACIDDTWRYTGKLGNFCGEPNVAVAYTATNALSTFGIKPTTPSVLVEVATPASQPFGGAAASFVTRAFEQEGLECAETTSTSCINSEPDFIDIVRSTVAMPNMGILVEEAYFSIVNGHFNEYFTPSRKYTNTFRYANLAPAPATAGVSVGRAHIQAFGTTTNDGNVFVHELAHGLGLESHKGDNSHGITQNDWVANYPSIMNYRYHDNYAGKNPVNGPMFPTDYFNSCTLASQCPSSNQCVEGRCMRCGIENATFSRGLNPSLGETGAGVNDVAGWTSKLAAELGCAPELRNTIVEPMDWRPRLVSGTYAIDWNGNGIWTDVGYNWHQGADFNFNGLVDTSVDLDDWKRMYSRGRDELSRKFFGEFRVFASDFQGVPPTDWSVGHTTFSTSNLATFPPHAAWPTTSIRFNGSSSFLRANMNTSIKSAGAQVDSEIPVDGFRFDVYFRIDDDAAPIAGSDIVRSSLFGLEVSPSGTLLGHLNTNGTMATPLQLTNVVAQGKWYWVAIQWKRSTGRARLSLVERVSGEWDYVNAACTSTIRTPTVEVDPGNVVFGGDAARPDRRFKGLMDQPTLWNAARCYYQFEDLFMIASNCGGVGIKGCEK